MNDFLHYLLLPIAKVQGKTSRGGVQVITYKLMWLDVSDLSSSFIFPARLSRSFSFFPDKRSSIFSLLLCSLIVLSCAVGGRPSQCFSAIRSGEGWAETRGTDHNVSVCEHKANSTQIVRSGHPKGFLLLKLCLDARGASQLSSSSAVSHQVTRRRLTPPSSAERPVRY